MRRFQESFPRGDKGLPGDWCPRGPPTVTVLLRMALCSRPERELLTARRVACYPIFLIICSYILPVTICFRYISFYNNFAYIIIIILYLLVTLFIKFIRYSDVSGVSGLRYAYLLTACLILLCIRHRVLCYLFTGCADDFYLYLFDS